MVSSPPSASRRELSGADTYYGLTPTDTREPEELLMTLGWFTGLVPLTVPVTRIALPMPPGRRGILRRRPRGHRAFRLTGSLGLADWLDKPTRRLPAGQLFRHRSAAPVGVPDFGSVRREHQHVFRRSAVESAVLLGGSPQHQTMVTVLYPGNPVARESIETYVKAVRSVFCGLPKVVTSP